MANITTYLAGTYTSREAALSIVEHLPKQGNKTYSLQNSKVTLLTPLKGVLFVQYQVDNEKQKVDISRGESLIVPPNTNLKINANDDNGLDLLQWITIEVPTNFVNQTIVQFSKDCKVRIDDNAAWQFGATPINSTHDTGIKQVIERLLYLFTEVHYNQEAFIEFALKELVLRYVQTPARDKIVLPINANNPSIEAVLEYIKEHIDEPISIDTLTDIANMSKAAFFRTFKETLDISPVDYINRERIAIAKNRLIDISKSVTDICYELGYNHMTYFIRVFKKYEGITPKQFQMKQSKKDGPKGDESEEE